jgi:hypothetical protein
VRPPASLIPPPAPRTPRHRRRPQSSKRRFAVCVRSLARERPSCGGPLDHALLRHQLAVRSAPVGPACANVTRRTSAPLCIEARAFLDPADLGVPFIRCLLETETVSSWPASFPSEGPLPALDHCNRRQRSRLATGTGSFLQEESTGKEPQAHHVLVRQLEGYWVERILTERPQFLRERPSVGLD